MSNKEMKVVDYDTQRNNVRAWEIKDTLIADGIGDWVIIPDEIQSISVSALPSGGASCKIQLTTSPLIDVKNNTAEPKDWDDGLVTALTVDVFFPVTAIRIVQSGAGQSILTARAQ